jgi:hypothetical protein
MIHSNEKEGLMREIIEERLAYHSPAECWGKRIERSANLKKKMEKLTSKERDQLEKEIERIKFERVKALFEVFYR